MNLSTSYSALHRDVKLKPGRVDWTRIGQYQRFHYDNYNYGSINHEIDVQLHPISANDIQSKSNIDLIPEALRLHELSLYKSGKIPTDWPTYEALPTACISVEREPRIAVLAHTGQRR